MAPSPSNLHISKMAAKIKKNKNCCKLVYVKDSKLLQNNKKNIIIIGRSLMNKKKISKVKGLRWGCGGGRVWAFLLVPTKAIIFSL